MVARKIGIELELEQVEVTLAGFLPPYEASTMREFLPGLRRFYLLVEGERACELREDQAETIAAALQRGRFRA